MDIKIRKVKASGLRSCRESFGNRGSKYRKLHDRIAKMKVGDGLRVILSEANMRMANPIRAYEHFEGKATFTVRRLDCDGFEWGIIRKS